jgi:hypothetical protein
MNAGQPNGRHNPPNRRTNTSPNQNLWRFGRVHARVGRAARPGLYLSKWPCLTRNHLLTNDPKLPRRIQNGDLRRAAQRSLQWAADRAVWLAIRNLLNEPRSRRSTKRIVRPHLHSNSGYCAKYITKSPLFLHPTNFIKSIVSTFTC